jgi:hypothetical protein
MRHDNSQEGEEAEDSTREVEDSNEEIKPAISYRTAMVGYAVLAILCFATLHGNPLFLALLIIAALAIKTWLAKVKSKLD